MWDRNSEAFNIYMLFKDLVFLALHPIFLFLWSQEVGMVS